MTVTLVDSPLAAMVETTPTDYWNDSCAVAELGLRGRARRHRGDVQSGHRRRGDEEGARPLDAPRPRARGRAAHSVRGRAQLGPHRGDGRPGCRDPGARVRSACRAQGPPEPADQSRPLPRSRRDGQPGCPLRRPRPQPPGQVPVHRGGPRRGRGGDGPGRRRQRDRGLHPRPGARRGRGDRARPRAGRGGRHRHDRWRAGLLADGRAPRRLAAGPRRARRHRAPSRRPRTGRASRSSSGPTPSTASAATGPACSPRPTAAGSTGPSSWAATSS